jgi:hypothetical protein
VLHVVFWLAVLVFYTFYFGRANADYRQSLLFVFLLLPVTIATTYFILYFLIPRYLLTRRYGHFALYACYTLITSIYLNLLLVVLSFIFLADYEAGAMQEATRDSLNLIVGLYFVVFLAVAANLLERWYTMQTAHAEAERAHLETELKLKEAELKLLRDQIHPHFLFNTLNNLYGLTLTGSAHAPDVVLHISEMLDYMLYRCNAPRVPLAGEVDMLHNYLALEKLRYGPRVEVTFETPEPTDEQLATRSIAPLLLLPFVENSFKHGVSQDRGVSRVEIELMLADRDLTFTVTNTKPPDAPPAESHSGIGLANVRKRLDLLYPGAYRLDINEAPRRFRITLHLKLDDPT